MSNQKCCVPGCATSAGSKTILHKFPNPTKDRELFNTWLHSIGGEILGLQNDFIFKYRRVCHTHFEEKFWCRNNRLCKIAVPTKNMPAMSTLKFTIDQQRLQRPLKPIENIISTDSTSKALPGTLYDVEVDDQQKLLRPIENIRASNYVTTSRYITTSAAEPSKTAAEVIETKELNMEPATVPQLEAIIPLQQNIQKTAAEVIETGILIRTELRTFLGQ